MFDAFKMFLLLVSAILIISFISGLIAFAIDLIKYKSTFDGAMKRDDILEKLMFGTEEQEAAAPEEPDEAPPRKEYEIDVS
ncbi:MAG: hypothetical protein IJ740_01815 [Ruminococcus sp.]|nr:hypothetical protein [Ruminococcus sp.]